MAEAKVSSAADRAQIGWNWQTVLDVLFALVLPVICILLDPGIIAVGPLAPELAQLMMRPGFLSLFQLPLYLLIASLILGFWLSFLQGLPGILDSALRGMVLLGMILSGLFSVFLLPLTFLALIGEPLLAPFGPVPALTAWRFYRRYRETGGRASGSQNRTLGFGAGFISPVVLAFIAHFGLYQIHEEALANLRSNEPEVVAAALETLVGDHLCQAQCKFEVVRYYCSGKLEVSPERFVELFGDKTDDSVDSDGTCVLFD